MMLSRTSLSMRAPRAQTRLMAVGKPGEKLAIAVATTSAALSAAAPARADDAVDVAVTGIIGAIQAAGAAAKTGVTALEAGLALVQQGIEVATPVVQQAYQVAEPYVEEAVKAATPVVQSAVPVVQASFDEAVRSSGVPVAAITDSATTVVKTVGQGVDVATPYVATAAAFLTAQEPSTLGEYALGAVALYYLSPVLLGLLATSLRGYAGELPAAEALNLINSERDVFVVDVRTAKEKETSGLPDVAAGARNRVVEVELAVTEDRRLRGQLRDAGGIETQITALQIAALKGLGKGSRVIVLDRYGGAAAAVAKELGRRGFSKVYTVAGGFDGRNGWVQSKLQIKPALIAAAPATTIFRGTVAKKALPAPKA